MRRQPEDSARSARWENRRAPTAGGAQGRVGDEVVDEEHPAAAGGQHPVRGHRRAAAPLVVGGGEHEPLPVGLGREPVERGIVQRGPQGLYQRPHMQGHPPVARQHIGPGE